MELNTDIIEAAKKYIEELFKNEFSGHDYYHAIRVYNIAAKIAVEEKADLQIVSLVAILHDVDDRKLFPETYLKKENLKRFLTVHNISKSECDSIYKIVDEVSYKGIDSVVPASIEGKCVQDADRLDAIGAIGIARAFAYGGVNKQVIYNPNILPVIQMTDEVYKKHSTTTLNHFYEKLFSLKEMMNTKTAKEIAKRRTDFMKNYVDEFLLEWNQFSDIK